MRYVEMPELLAASDVISVHCPLTTQTRHLIDADALSRMMPSAMVLITSRGAVVDTRALVAAQKAGTLGSLGLDVYEKESDLFFRDLLVEVLNDDVFASLLTFPNELITRHQAFFTEDALAAIAATTMANPRRLRGPRPTGVPSVCLKCRTCESALLQRWPPHRLLPSWR